MNRIKASASRENIIAVATLIAITLIYLLLSRNQAIRSWLESASQDLIALLKELGLVGAFLVTVIANTSVIVQIPYPPLFIFLASQSESLAYLSLLTLVGTVGGTIGEGISYSIGRGIGSTGLMGDRLAASIHNVLSSRRQYIPVFAFVLAATPFPDDLLLIPLGISKYGFRRILLPIFLGKGIVLGALVAFAYNANKFVGTIAGGSVIDPTLVPLLIILFIVFILFQTRKARESQKKGDPTGEMGAGKTGAAEASQRPA